MRRQMILKCRVSIQISGSQTILKHPLQKDEPDGFRPVQCGSLIRTQSAASIEERSKFSFRQTVASFFPSL